MIEVKAWRWQLEVLAVRHGLWVLPGVAALLFALAAWVWWMPAQEAALQDALFQLAEQGRTGKAQGADVVAEGMSLPEATRAADGVQRLFALAGENGLQIAQADYRRQEVGHVGRWQVQVPLTGNYPQIRRFVRAAQVIPGLSLDELTLRRADAGVEARLLFSIWFSAGNVSAPISEGKR